MIFQEELDEFKKEFNDEDPALVNEALEECVKLFGSGWNTMSRGRQVDCVFSWIAAFKKFQKPYFTIKENGWGSEWKAGKTIPLKFDESDG